MKRRENHKLEYAMLLILIILLLVILIPVTVYGIRNKQQPYIPPVEEKIKEKTEVIEV